MSLFKKLFGEAPEQRTMLDDGKEITGRIIIKGYRKISAQHGCAPTAKTTDQKIVEIYSTVGAAFHEAAERRGEHIPALLQNSIVLKFLEVYETTGEKFLQEHLQYEVSKYLREGLRPDYQRELPLFDENSDDPDVVRLRELQTMAQKKLLPRLNNEEQHTVHTTNRKSFGLCPKCKTEVLEWNARFSCQAQGCGFYIPKVILGQVLSSAQATNLLRDGRTDLLSEFISTKTGHPFAAWLVLDGSGKLRFDFSPGQGSHEITESRQQVSTSTEWTPVIQEVVGQFRVRRTEWFAACIVLLKNESRLRVNPRLEGRSEIATWVYQCAMALSFVAEKQYIPSESGKAFATQLFTALLKDGQPDHALAKELYKLQLAALERNDGSDIMELCGLIAEQILVEQDAFAAMKLAKTIPIFTNISNSVIAQAFGDIAMVKRLVN